MNLRGIVSVSGKPGLFKLLAQNKSGFVLESLDAQKLKLVVNMSTAKLASLEDITVFGDDEDLKLVDIFEKMKSAASIPAPNEDGKKLRAFFNEVAPGHDEERVYASDMKKIINWFNIIKELPLFNEAAPDPLDAATQAANARRHEQAAIEERSKPVSKASGKGATRLPRKAS
jgi:hypothetical protein